MSLLKEALVRLATHPVAQAIGATVARRVKDAIQNGAVEVVLDLLRRARKDEDETGGQS